MIKRLDPYYEEPQPLPYKGTRIRIQLMSITDLWGFFSKFNYKVYNLSDNIYDNGENVPWTRLSVFVIGDPESFKVSDRARRKVTEKWNRLVRELTE